MNKFLLIATLFFMAQVGYSQEDKQYLTQEAFEAEINTTVKARDVNKITRLQFMQRTANTIKKFMPEAYELHTLADYRVLLAAKLEKKKISREEHDYMWSERLNEHLAKVKKAEDQARAEQEYSQTRAAAQARREQAYREQMAAAEAEAARQQQIQATAGFLQGIGNAFRNAAPRSPVTCSSLPVGASVSTTCY